MELLSLHQLFLCIQQLLLFFLVEGILLVLLSTSTWNAHYLDSWQLCHVYLFTVMMTIVEGEGGGHTIPVSIYSFDHLIYSGIINLLLRLGNKPLLFFPCFLVSFFQSQASITNSFFNIFHSSFFKDKNWFSSLYRVWTPNPQKQRLVKFFSTFKNFKKLMCLNFHPNFPTCTSAYFKFIIQYWLL